MKNFSVLFMGMVVCVMFAITAVESKMLSYMSDDPKACVNCHVMNSAYNAWAHSSHARDTNCNSCHVPHDSIFNKLLFKAKDGLRHSYMFTRSYAPNLILNEESKEVVRDNCISCHSAVLSTINHESKERLCWECHTTVPHGKLRSRSNSRNVPVPYSVSKKFKLLNKEEREQ